METHKTDTQAALRKLERNKITWVDVKNPSAEVFAELEQTYRLHPVHLSESVQKVQHTQVEHEDNYLFLVLHFPVFEFHSDKILVGQVGVFLGKDFLVTVHTTGSPFIDNLFSLCQQSSDELEKSFEKGSAYLLYLLISRLLGNISGMTEIVETELDEIESLVFENNGSDAQRIGMVRQKIVRLRRLIGPKRLVLQDLTEQIASFTDDSMARYYSNNVKMVNKLWEVIEESKETIEIYKDADFTTSTEQTNKILAILTLVFTFTIPVTVVGTLYGMNVILPGSVNGTPWTFLGRYTTFGLLVALSTFLAAAMYWYFKKKKWF